MSTSFHGELYDSQKAVPCNFLFPSRFNEEMNLFIAHVFSGGSGEFPWVDCYLYNFCNTLERVWLFADDYPTSRQAKEDFRYPVVGKMTGELEMPVSVIPRVPRNLSCDICGSKKIPKHQNKLWPVAFSHSRNDAFFPRKILRVHAPRNEWPGGDIKKCRRSVGVVCKRECVVKCEGLKYPGIETRREEDMLAGHREAEYVEMLAGQGSCNLADLVHLHLLQKEAKRGEVSHRLADLNVSRPPYTVFNAFDMVDRRFLPDRFESVFSLQSLERQVWKDITTVDKEDEEEVESDPEKSDTDTPKSDSDKEKEGKLWSTHQLRKWRSEVASKNSGANLDVVGTLSLFVNDDENRQAEFRIGLNRSFRKGQGHSCNQVGAQFFGFKTDKSTHSLPNCRFSMPFDRI